MTLATDLSYGLTFSFKNNTDYNKTVDSCFDDIDVHVDFSS